MGPVRAVVAGVGPFALVGWTTQPPLLGLPCVRVVGVAAGLACLLDCFALEGCGTPAPVAQSEMLVASGLYRFLRNPMYVSLLIIVSGQALLFGQARLFAYAGAILVAFHLFVRFYEERILRRRFGGSYETYLPVRGSMVATSDTVARVSYVSQSIAFALKFPVSFFYRPDIETPSVGTASFRSMKSMTAGERDVARATGAIAFELSEWIDAAFELPWQAQPWLKHAVF